jgi:ABC-type sugar transport system substrate-binding protein
LFGAATLLLSGCSSATGSAQEGPTAGSNSCTKAVQADVDAARAPSELALPADPAPAAGLAGKSVWFIALTMNQFNGAVAEGFTAGAEAAGLTPVLWDGQGTTNRINDGFAQAIAAGAAAIAISGIDVTTVGPNLDLAQQLGIPVLATFDGDASQPVAEGLYSNITSDFTADGESIAKWSLVNSGCAVDMLMVSSPTVAVWERQADGAKSALEEFCPDDCSFTDVDVDLANLATDTPQKVQTALQRDPDTNYVYMAWDSGVPFVQSTIETGFPDTRILGRDGVDASIQSVMQGRAQVLSLAMPPEQWIGWATVDDLIRGATGLEPSGLVIPSRLVDADNVGDGTDAAISPNYEGFEEKFEELWGMV